MGDLAKNAKRKWQQMLGQEPEEAEEAGILAGLKQDADDCCGSMCKLTRKQRLYGFAYCLAGGIIIAFIGAILAATGNLTAFAVCYTFGTILSLASTLFLWGPWYQLKNMFKETRMFATIIMLAAIVMTLVAAFVLKSGGLTILFAIIQFFAVTWYSLSYIPYARAAVSSCFRSCMNQ